MTGVEVVETLRRLGQGGGDGPAGRRGVAESSKEERVALGAGKRPEAGGGIVIHREHEVNVTSREG